MYPSFRFLAFGVLLFAITFSVPATLATGNAISGPAIKIEEALTIVNKLIAKKALSVSDFYIDSVKFNYKINEDRGSFWLITFLNNRYASGLPIKGGQTCIRVFMDGSTEISYGE